THRALLFSRLASPLSDIYTLSYTTLFRSCRAWRLLWSLPVALIATRKRRCGSCDRFTWAWRWSWRSVVRTAAMTERAEAVAAPRSEEHTSELQSRENLVCRLLLEKKKKNV